MSISIRISKVLAIARSIDKIDGLRSIQNTISKIDEVRTV